MSIVKQEDIMGYEIGEQLICADCVKDDEIGGLIEDKIITRQDVEAGGGFFPVIDAINRWNNLQSGLCSINGNAVQLPLQYAKIAM